VRQNWRKEYIFTDLRYRNWIIWIVFRLRRSTSFRKRSGLMATTRMTIMLQSLDRKGFQATGCHGLLPIMVCRYWTHQWAFCNNVKGENYAVWGKFRINEGEQNWSCIHSLGEGGGGGGKPSDGRSGISVCRNLQFKFFPIRLPRPITISPAKWTTFLIRIINRIVQGNERYTSNFDTGY